MNDDSQNSTASLVELSKLLHTHDWPGDISLLIGSFLDETVLKVELYEMGPPPPPPKLATGSVRAATCGSRTRRSLWAPICKERWWGDVRIASGDIVENGSYLIDHEGTRKILRERYHMDLAPDASWLAGHTFERPRVHFVGQDLDY